MIGRFFFTMFYTRTQIWKKNNASTNSLHPRIRGRWCLAFEIVVNHHGNPPFGKSFCNPSIKQANPINLPALETKQLASFLKSSDSSDGPNAMDEHGRCGISLLQRGALKPRKSNKTTGIFVLLPLQGGPPSRFSTYRACNLAINIFSAVYRDFHSIYN